MPKKPINTNLRQILTFAGLVLILFSSSFTFSAPNVTLLTKSLPATEVLPIPDKHYSVTTFFNHDILDELLMAEEIISDDDVLESSYKINHFVFVQHFDTRLAVFIAHNNSIAHNRHLYLLYCSWRHFTFL